MRPAVSVNSGGGSEGRPARRPSRMSRITAVHRAGARRAVLLRGRARARLAGQIAAFPHRHSLERSRISAKALSAMTIIATPVGALGLQSNRHFVCILRMAASACQLVPDDFVRTSFSERSSAKSPCRQVNAAPALDNCEEKYRTGRHRRRLRRCCFGRARG